MINGTLPADAPPSGPVPGLRGPAVAGAERLSPVTGGFTVSALSYAAH